MFIAITTPQNPLRLENTLRPYKRGEKPFTPEVARQILQSTNHKKNIADTLQLIASLPKEEQAQYKDIILAAFDHREQPADNLLLGKKLAASNGFEYELNAILTHDPLLDMTDGVIYASAPHTITAYINAKETPDLAEYPKDATLYCTNSKVELSHMDLAKFAALKFKAGANVQMFNCQNFPADLDFSTCNEIDLSYTDLAAVKTLKFKAGSEVNLYGCQNPPADLDVSMCSKANLGNIDFARVNSLKFKEGAAIKLYGSQNLPADTDFSPCQKVCLFKTDLSNLKSLKFREGATVELLNCQNLPEHLDFSMCSKVDIEIKDFSAITSLKFKNRQQQENSRIQIPEDWQGNIIYTDDFPLLSRINSIFTR